MQTTIIDEETGKLLLNNIIKEDSLSQALKLIQEVGKYKNVAYFMAASVNAQNAMPFFQATYSKKWIEQYIRKNYINIDPIVTHGLVAKDHFIWSDFDNLDIQQIDFFNDAIAHGVGKSGVTIPLFLTSNTTAIFSLTGDFEQDDWREKITAEIQLLKEIGRELHLKATLELFSISDNPILSRREIECLNLTAKGKESPAIATELGISEHTVRDYLKSVRKKLGCKTLAQAVFKATKMRIIGH